MQLVTYRDMNEAISVLNAMKHWTLKTNNSKGVRRNHECCIWHDGRRVSAVGMTPLLAIGRAVAKLSESPNAARAKVAGLKLIG